MRNKFDALTQQIIGNVDILMLSETKLDSSFPEGQFLSPGYSAPWIDRTCHGGGLMLFVREDIPSKLLLAENAPIEGFYIEINLRKKKWLICGSYNPHRTTIDSHMDSLSKNLALYSSTYENYIVLGDFNVEVDNNAISSFCDAFDLVNLIREPTCYKNPEKPSCIDLILTNKPHSFKNSGVIATGLSDFHRITVTITKMTFQKLKPRIINYREDYKLFHNIRYRNDLLQEISNSYLEFNDNGFSGFFDICRTTSDQHAPRKKYVRGDHMPFINKTSSKEIMKGTKLRNKFLKDRTEENRSRYASQRNYCVSLLKKTKKEYFGNLNQKKCLRQQNILENSKAFSFGQIVSKEQTTLVENNEIISEDGDVAQTLNSFFSNIVTNLKIPT